MTLLEEELLKKEERLVGTLITDKPQRNGFLVAFGTVSIMAMVTLFYWSDPLGWAEYLPAVRESVFSDGEWWRVFSAIFIHADIGHYLSNMYMLGIFSFFIFAYFGFSLYPVLAFVAAALVNVVAILTYEPHVRLLGASGLVYVLGGLWLTLYFLIQRQYNILGRTLRVVGIGIMIFFPTTFVPTTSYRTHAFGFAAGVVLGVIFFLKNKQSIRSHEKYKISYV